MFVYGRLPLAYSARCLPPAITICQDDCRFRAVWITRKV